MNDDHPSLGRALWRGATRRCARCGSGRLFSGYFTMRARCHGCDLAFEREEGYRTGAMMINIVVTEAIFFAVFVGLTVLTWPHVPWTGILVTVVLLNVAVPIVFYPWSKTIWVALERHVRRWRD